MVLLISKLFWIHYKGHWKGWTLKKIETFLGTKMSTSEAVPFGPKKSREGGAPGRIHTHSPAHKPLNHIAPLLVHVAHSSQAASPFSYL